MKKLFLLTINAGSSSIKVSIFDKENIKDKVFDISIMNITQDTSNFIVLKNGLLIESINYKSIKDYSYAIKILINWLKKNIDNDEIFAIGHRIVHGGPIYYKSMIVNDKIIEELQKFLFFDKEHLLQEIKLIKVLQKQYPNIRQIVCFDTEFHHDLPNIAKIIPIPSQFKKEGIRKYGFHGLSYSYILGELKSITGNIKGRLIIAHLGNGVSLSAIKNGEPIDTTMSLSPSSGVPMSTRVGNIDPSLAMYLIYKKKFSESKFNDIMNFKSGLLGISGLSSDMRELLKFENNNIRAKEAIDLFCYEIKKNIGSFIAILGGIDNIVFTGGIGENAPEVRKRICSDLEFLGIEIDDKKNMDNEILLSTKKSNVSVYAIHTDESIIIAKNILQIVNKK